MTLEYRLLLENNDSQLIFLRFTEPAEGVWKLELLSVQRAVGDVHIWLPVQEFLSGEVFFLEADADTTVTEPGSSRAAMTVAYYNGRDNGVDIHSGRGYTRNEIIKPDYAAPGTEVTGAGIGRRVRLTDQFQCGGRHCRRSIGPADGMAERAAGRRGR